MLAWNQDTRMKLFAIFSILLPVFVHPQVTSQVDRDDCEEGGGNMYDCFNIRMGITKLACDVPAGADQRTKFKQMKPTQGAHINCGQGCIGKVQFNGCLTGHMFKMWVVSLSTYLQGRFCKSVETNISFLPYTNNTINILHNHNQPNTNPIIITFSNVQDKSHQHSLSWEEAVLYHQSATVWTRWFEEQPDDQGICRPTL